MGSPADALSLSERRRFPPAVVALFAHLAAWLPLLPLVGLGWPAFALVGLQGGLVLLLSRWFGLPAWWQAINGLFFPLVWGVAQIEIAPGWFLAGFALLFLTSLGSLGTRVPLYLSSRQAVAALAERLPPGARVIDLGCGLGSMLVGLRRLRPDLHLAGIEMAPLNWLIARLRLGRDIQLGSLWEADLSRHDVVYAYLSPAPMARLWKKAEQEMRAGSLLISNSFEVPGHPSDETVALHDFNQSRLLIWRR
ncbi:MAG: hypothetical protein ACOZB0_00325 [Pseudomonadota bacterium]